MSAELRSSSVVGENRETPTNRIEFTISDRAAISRQLIATRDSGSAFVNSGKSRNRNQMKTPAASPVKKPVLLACGQYSIDTSPGRNCRHAVNATVPIVWMLI